MNNHQNTLSVRDGIIIATGMEIWSGQAAADVHSLGIAGLPPEKLLKGGTKPLVDPTRWIAPMTSARRAVDRALFLLGTRCKAGWLIPPLNIDAAIAALQKGEQEILSHKANLIQNLDLAYAEQEANYPDWAGWLRARRKSAKEVDRSITVDNQVLALSEAGQNHPAVKATMERMSNSIVPGVLRECSQLARETLKKSFMEAAPKGKRQRVKEEVRQSALGVLREIGNKLEDFSMFDSSLRAVVTLVQDTLNAMPNTAGQKLSASDIARAVTTLSVLADPDTSLAIAEASTTTIEQVDQAEADAEEANDFDEATTDIREAPIVAAVASHTDAFEHTEASAEVEDEDERVLVFSI